MITELVLSLLCMQINSDMDYHIPTLANFWLDTLDGRQRRQLLFPLKQTLSHLLCGHWRTDKLDTITLYQIFKKLFIFMLSSGGKGLWASIMPRQ